MVPADVPAVTAGELSALAEEHGAGRAITLVADRRGVGTNALAATPPDLCPFLFGEESFERHLQAARNAGVEPKVMDVRGLRYDVDVENDLDEIAMQSPGPETSDLLRRFGRVVAPARQNELAPSEETMVIDRVALDRIVAGWAAGRAPSREDALALDADAGGSPALLEAASALRDQGFGGVVTYSKKVFLPLTHLCRDICHYCVFARPPRRGEAAYMTREQVLEQAGAAAAAGCKEALFTLGDKPERRYRAAREGLAELGHATTLDYLREAAQLVFEKTGLLPHLNPGLMTADDFAALRPVSASMGIMLESVSARLNEKGGAHYGSPDKVPARRLETLRLAGEARVPFTTGILIGIGETRRERIESLLAIRELHAGARPHPGDHRPELPRQARDADGRSSRAVARRSAVDDRGGAAGVRSVDERAGAAQPVAGRARADRRRRHQRLGRRVADHARLRQPRSALAAPRAAGRGDRARRQAAAGTADRSIRATRSTDGPGSTTRSGRACSR